MHTSKTVHSPLNAYSHNFEPSTRRDWFDNQLTKLVENTIQNGTELRPSTDMTVGMRLWSEEQSEKSRRYYGHELPHVTAAANKHQWQRVIHLHNFAVKWIRSFIPTNSVHFLNKIIPNDSLSTRVVAIFNKIEIKKYEMKETCYETQHKIKTHKKTLIGIFAAFKPVGFSLTPSFWNLRHPIFY